MVHLESDTVSFLQGNFQWFENPEFIIIWGNNFEGLCQFRCF